MGAKKKWWQGGGLIASVCPCVSLGVGTMFVRYLQEEEYRILFWQCIVAVAELKVFDISPGIELIELLQTCESIYIYLQIGLPWGANANLNIVSMVHVAMSSPVDTISRFTPWHGLCM